MSTVILAVDPGPRQSALVYYDPDRKQVISHQIVRNREAAAEIELEALRLEGTEAAPKTTHLAIELIRSSYGSPAGAELFDTAMWAGRFLGGWLAGPREIASTLLIPRIEIKVHLCGTAKSADKDVRTALMARLGFPATAGVATHCWAALAVAVTAADRIRCGMAGKEKELCI